MAWEDDDEAEERHEKHLSEKLDRPGSTGGSLDGGRRGRSSTIPA
jgi:hypothetical protein